MADQELFDGTPVTEIQDDENIAVQQPNPAGAGSKVISFTNFKALLRTLFVWLGNVNQNIDGIKTFLKSPIVPDPTTDLQAVNLRTLNLKTTDPTVIKFDIDNAPTVTEEGYLYWNKQYYTLEYDTGFATVKIGQTEYFLFYNNSGVEIDPFKCLHLQSGADVGGELFPVFELADASKWELTQGTLIISCCATPDGSLGIGVLRAQKITGGSTLGIPAGSQLWLSDDGTGSITNVKPVFPSYSISLGGNYNEAAAPDGEIIVSITKDLYDTFGDGWDGAIRETFDFKVSSDGVTVTGTLTNVNPVNDLTLLFSDGFYTFDTTPGGTISLTAGTDESTTTNFVYIPMSTKVLTISTSGFPVTEHCKIAQLEVQSAVTVQADGGVRRNQNINDHLKEENDNGHILHIAERIRQLNAQHSSGTAGALNGTQPNGYIDVTGGEVWQLHRQAFPAISMTAGDSIMIANDFTTAYRSTNNLNTVTAYSDGVTWNNEWSNIVIWGVINKTGEPSFLFCNVPSDGYNNEANALDDRNNYANYVIPAKYKGVGFLIARFTIRISGGTIEYNSSTGYTDLRGFVPNNVAGAGGGGGGVTDLLSLADVFIASYAGKARYKVIVNDLEKGIEAVEDPNMIPVRYTEAINEGESVVYTTYDATENIPGVRKATPSNQNKMTLVGFADADYLTNEIGWICKSKILTGQDTSTTNEGDEVFIANGGGWTIDRNNPEIMQAIGHIIKVDAIDGHVDLYVDNTVLGGKKLEAFSAIKTFNCKFLSDFKMPLTGSTTLSLSNKVNGGKYKVILETDGTGGYLVTLDSTFGTKTDMSFGDITNAVPGATYIISVEIDAEGDSYYSINTKSASKSVNVVSESFPYSASFTFNLKKNIGGVYEMTLSGNTIPAISNEIKGGTYIIIFDVDGTGGYSIAPDSSFGERSDNSVENPTNTTANAHYMYTIVVRPGGSKFYTLETIGA